MKNPWKSLDVNINQNIFNSSFNMSSLPSFYCLKIEEQVLMARDDSFALRRHAQLDSFSPISIN